MFDIKQYLNEKKKLLVTVADEIWGFSELKNEEYCSSKLLEKTLEEQGFHITSGIAELDTAFVAQYGEGSPIIAFLGEYDALPDLSQEAGIAVHKPITEGGPGHGCMHHVLGTAAMGAAMGVKEFLDKNNMKGTVRFYGCPAEEGGTGKQHMALHGVFDDVDAAITWHPTDDNNIWSMNFLATMSATFTFHGISAGAPALSHLGRSALEAVELMGVGSNYLRGHVQRDVCINYAITNAGGIAPNVIPDRAQVIYLLRANTRKKVSEVFKRLKDIAQGAALMSGTSVEYEQSMGTSELIQNRALERILYDKLAEIGPVSYNDEDISFSRELRKTFPEMAESSTFDTLKMLYGEIADQIIPQIKGKDINDVVYPYVPIETAKYGSTDVCDVSWFTPVAQVTTACYVKDTPGHSWQATAQGKTNLCRNGMMNAAKIMALAGAELFVNPDELQAVRSEFLRATEGKDYRKNFE